MTNPEVIGMTTNDESMERQMSTTPVVRRVKGGAAINPAIPRANVSRKKSTGDRMAGEFVSTVTKPDEGSAYGET